MIATRAPQSAQPHIGRVPYHVALVAAVGNLDTEGPREAASRPPETDGVIALVDAALELGIAWLTVREPSEGHALAPWLEQLDQRGVRVLYDVGAVSRAEHGHRAGVAGHQPRLTVLVATQRSGRAEIVAAVQRLADAGARPDEVGEEVLGAGLHAPDVDLLVMTGGDRRVPDFLLWEIAYSEIVVVEEPWAEIGPQHLRDAVAEYQRRDRRYGGLVTSGKSP